MMTTATKSMAAAAAPKPPLMITAADYERLAALGSAVIDRMPELAETLLDEIERAEVVPVLPAGTVGMGSEVTFREHEGGTERTVTLVYPGDADLQAGRLSVLTPVGAALIGLAEGDRFAWRTRMGTERTLTVLAVRQPS